MKFSRLNNRPSKAELIGGLIYLSLGAISLASYFMDKKGIRMKFISNGKLADDQSCKANESQKIVNMP